MMRHGRTALLGSAAMLLVMIGGQAHAQENGITAQLEEVVVEGQGVGQGAATSPVDGYVAKETATGSKTATPIQAIPQAVSVVGRDEIDDRGAQKVDEALRYTAGVLAQPFGSDSDTNWLFIRGFQTTQTGTYMDGLQLQSYAFGGFFIDSFLLERIEVLKGPASVLYGGANPGGIVNYVSKRPTGDAFTRVEAGIDSFGTGYLGFDVDGAGTLNGGSDGSQGGVDYRVTGRLYGGDGYTDFSDQLLGTISPSITWKPDEATSLTVLANYTHLEKAHEGGSFLPYVGTVVDTPFGRIDREFNYTEPDLDRYDREQVSIGYEFEHTFDSDWTVRQNARYGHAQVEEVALYPFGYLGFATTPTGADFSLERINFGHDSEVNNFLMDNQIEGKFDTGAVNHTLLVGADYKYFNLDQLQESTSSSPFSADPSTPIDPTDPIYGLDQGTRVPYINQDLKSHQLGVYVQDQLRFGDGWIVTLNGRYDQVWLDSYNRILDDLGLQAREKQSEGEFSGRAGVAYEFANGITPYASVATFFSPLYDTDTDADGDFAPDSQTFFEPETGEQYEVGVKYAPDWINATFTAAFFDITRQNIAVGIAGSTLREQIGEVRSRGFELEAKADLTDQLQMVGALTALDLEVTEDDNEAIIGKSPTLVPEMQASLFLDYTFRTGVLDGVVVGGGVRYVGKSYANNINTLEVDDVTLADARIGYKKDNWGVDLTVTNLFDKEHVSSCQDAYTCSYGESRKALLKMNVEW